jgi:catechol 2,3-dioxygenase-like lactoylglutathione lyase family enzyme
MVRHPDHVTVVVRDVAAAKAFFALLGFEAGRSALISGERMERYMGVAGIEAEHETLVLAGAEPRFEMQLLHYRHPASAPDPHAGDPSRLGFNHLCFAVDDLDAEVRRLTAHGVRLRNQVMQFHDRKLVFLDGPEGLTVELAQWL